MSRERDHAACDAFAAMPPADSDPALLQATAERVSAAFNADISVFGPQGGLVAEIGRPISPQKFGSPRRILPGGHHLLISRQLDGSVIAARLRMPLGQAGFLALIAAVIGLAAFPVVRHLTHRLEAMRQGVDRWGAGALDKRVAVRGSDEVAAVAASSNRAAEQFERLLAANSSLLANASHELRSPLARLRMAIDLIANEQSGPMRDEIVRNLAELDALVEEILLAGRLDHIEKLEPVDLLALTAEEGARSGVDVSGEPGVVSGDPKLLTRWFAISCRTRRDMAARRLARMWGSKAARWCSRCAITGRACRKEPVSASSSPSSGHRAAARRPPAGTSVPVAGAQDRLASRRNRAPRITIRRRRLLCRHVFGNILIWRAHILVKAGRKERYD
nr:histidine kinase dimerization/phospho-acceptor domain-containing protein [Mesorhizobium sp. AR07]